MTHEQRASVSGESSTETIVCNGERFRIYLTAATIKRRVAELGTKISQDYAGRRPILVGVLNGAFMFLADLMRQISVPCEVDFIKLSSYGDSKITRGVVHELKSVDAELSGKDVIIVEDIVDTGLSMQYLVETIVAYGPSSVSTATLLHKKAATKAHVDLDYVGFEINNLFVVGYGLDYGQLGRNLDSIYILDHAETDG